MHGDTLTGCIQSQIILAEDKRFTELFIGREMDNKVLNKRHATEPFVKLSWSTAGE